MRLGDMKFGGDYLYPWLPVSNARWVRERTEGSSFVQFWRRGEGLRLLPGRVQV